MPRFSVNTHRLDPYAAWAFRVKWDGRYVPGISRISGLAWTTDVAQHREGGDPPDAHLAPGVTAYLPVVLERGRTHDTAFEEWASLVAAPPGRRRSLKNLRKDVLVELLNEQQTPVMAFRLHRCWPSHYAALGPLDADAGVLARESLTLQHEGFERDEEVAEPAET